MVVVGFEEALGACFVSSSKLRALRVAGSIIVELAMRGGSLPLRELRAKGLADASVLAALERAGVVERVGRRSARLVLSDGLVGMLERCGLSGFPVRVVLAYIGVPPYTLVGRVLERLADGMFWSYDELARELGVNYSYVTRVVTTLAELGLVEKYENTGISPVGRPPYSIRLNRRVWSYYEGKLRARLTRFMRMLNALARRENEVEAG